MCLSLTHTQMHTNTHTNTQTHTCTHTDTNTHTHTHTHTYTHTHGIYMMAWKESILQFESKITNVEGTLSMFFSLYVGPSRSFNQYNYSLAFPCVQLSGTNTDTTVGDLIESYNHYNDNQEVEITSLIQFNYTLSLSKEFIFVNNCH